MPVSPALAGAAGFGNISTSPVAFSVPATSLNRIVPWRPPPVAWYSPLHSPASSFSAGPSPVTGTGRGAEEHAVIRPATQAAIPTLNIQFMEPPRLTRDVAIIIAAVRGTKQ